MLNYQRFSQQIVILVGKMMISPTKSDKTHMDCVRSAPDLQEWCHKQMLQSQLAWHLAQGQASVIYKHHFFPIL